LFGIISKLVSLTVSLLVLLFFVSEIKTKIVDYEKNYSLYPPKGWERIDNEDWTMFRDPFMIDGYYPNFIVQSFYNDKSLNEFFAEILLDFKSETEIKNESKRTSFKTKKGIKGIQYSFQRDLDGVLVKYYLYLFAKDKVKVTFLCFTPERASNTLSKEFKKAIKTFDFVW
jgi:hypothetical protein